MTKSLLSTLADRMIVALYNYKVVIIITLRALRMEDYFLLHLQKDDKNGALNSNLSHKEPDSFYGKPNGITYSLWP